MNRRKQHVIVNPSNGDKGLRRRILERDRQADGLMLKARAARVWSQTISGNNEDANIYAFLSIFHPDMSEEQKRDFLNKTERAERRRGMY